MRLRKQFEPTAAEADKMSKEEDAKDDGGNYSVWWE